MKNFFVKKNISKSKLSINLAIFRESYPHENLDELLFKKNISVIRYPLLQFKYVGKSENYLQKLLQEQIESDKTFKTIKNKVSPKRVWLFTSQQAVYRFMEIFAKWNKEFIGINSSLKKRTAIKKTFSKVQVASVGNSTSKLLKQFGFSLDFSVDEGQDSNIIKQKKFNVGQKAVFNLLKRSTIQEVVHPCAKKIDDYLAKQLKRIGVNYKPIPIYETVIIKVSRLNIKKLLKMDYWFISSPSIAHALLKSLPIDLLSQSINTKNTKSNTLPKLLVIGETSLTALEKVLKAQLNEVQEVQKNIKGNIRILQGDFSENISKRIVKTIKNYS